jgi:hypothetical protein
VTVSAQGKTSVPLISPQKVSKWRVAERGAWTASRGPEGRLFTAVWRILESCSSEQQEMRTLTDFLRLCQDLRVERTLCWLSLSHLVPGRNCSSFSGQTGPWLWLATGFFFFLLVIKKMSTSIHP